jgi:two-component system CheB/CheR fusion protein
VLVQNPESAGYPGMPKSAIDTGLVDKICELNEIAEIIQTHFNNHPGKIKKNDYPNEIIKDGDFKKIFSVLRTKTGHDFSGYKRSTLTRRIIRRMNLNQVDGVGPYLRLLRENPRESQILFKEFLIGVTSFFRDAESFEKLKDQMLKRYVRSLNQSDTIRVWVPACSTGEEVYSVTIVLREVLEDLESSIPMQIFATDIDGTAIQKAREGVYRVSIEEDISRDRLEKYFSTDGDYYRVKKEIRDPVVFSVQDLLKDPPFSRINLITCRNVLIYLEQEEQKRLLRLFHYTLKDNGILMLGPSESIGEQNSLYKTVDSKWKIFQKKEVPDSVRGRIEFPTGSGIAVRSSLEPVRGKQGKARTNFAHLLQEHLLKHYCPAGLLIDSSGNIIQVQGRMGKYLETVSGPGNQKVLEMARQGLQLELSSALRKAERTNRPEVRRGIRVKTNGTFQTISLHVLPLHHPEPLEGLFLIVFKDIEEIPEESNHKASSADDDGGRIVELEKELKEMRENHQATVEELESANEELKSTNEELQSSNEELQSTNEELESSKEELQSLNEESQTVNSELNNKVEELSAANDDVRNLLESSEVATIFVDDDCRIRRYTKKVTEIINLIRSDTGRPLAHVVHNLNYDNLIEDVNNVIDNLKTVRKEVSLKDGKWYLMKITPYYTVEKKIEGAVITFMNITEQKRTQDLLEDLSTEKEHQRELVRTVFDMNEQPLTVLDSDGQILIANQSFAKFIGSSVPELEHTDLFEQLNQKLPAKMKTELRKVMKKEGGFNIGSPGVPCQVKGRVLPLGPKKEYRILLQLEDTKGSDA